LLQRTAAALWQLQPADACATLQAQGTAKTCSLLGFANPAYTHTNACWFPQFDPMLVLLNFTSSWDFGIFGKYWISRPRCNIWCSLCAQASHEKASVSWFASVCTGSAFHKRNWSN
jgi:hypothetical protein